MTAFSPPLHPRPVRSPEKLCRFTSNGAGRAVKARAGRDIKALRGTVEIRGGKCG